MFRFWFHPTAAHPNRGPMETGRLGFPGGTRSTLGVRTWAV